MCGDCLDYFVKHHFLIKICGNYFFISLGHFSIQHLVTLLLAFFSVADSSQNELLATAAPSSTSESVSSAHHGNGNNVVNVFTINLTKEQSRIEDNVINANSNETKYQAQIVSARRSIFTNSFVVLTITLNIAVGTVMTDPAKTYFTMITTSIEKSILPIATMLGNFGMVQAIFEQYWMLIR